MTQLPLTGAGPSAAGYIAKVKSYNPIAYWPLNELTGSTAICQVNTAQNGTYTGVTLGQSVTDASGVSFVCPLFDGTNDYVNIYTATLNGVFDGSEGTMAIWVRTFNVGVWTDATIRRNMSLRVDADNQLRIGRTNINNTLQWYYEANNTKEQPSVAGYSSTDWFQVAMTWSLSAGATGEVDFYYNGASAIATSTGLGTWAGALATTKCCIGSLDTGPAGPWYGWLAHAALWDSALSATQIADLAVT